MELGQSMPLGRKDAGLHSANRVIDTLFAEPGIEMAEIVKFALAVRA